MLKHEEKICPRCGRSFECKQGDILHCQCYGVSLTTEASARLSDQYEDCLCRPCLEALATGSSPGHAAPMK